MSISILGINIKKIRDEKGINAKTLSELAKVGASTISEIETGIRQSLNGKTIEKIAAALGVSVDDLFATEADQEYMTSDVVQAMHLVLQDETMSLDDITMTDREKAQLMAGINGLLEMIRLQRK